jgi:hypothetical protein
MATMSRPPFVRISRFSSPSSVASLDKPFRRPAAPAVTLLNAFQACDRRVEILKFRVELRQHFRQVHELSLCLKYMN